MSTNLFSRKYRLRHLSYESKLRASPKKAEITGIAVQLDASKVSGGMVVEIRRKPGWAFASPSTNSISTLISRKAARLESLHDWHPGNRQEWQQ